MTRLDVRPAAPPVRAGALAAMTVTVLAWASAFVAIRGVGRAYEPGPLALGRLLLGTGALGVLLLSRGRWVRPRRREWVLALPVDRHSGRIHSQEFQRGCVEHPNPDRRNDTPPTDSPGALAEPAKGRNLH